MLKSISHKLELISRVFVTRAFWIPLLISFSLFAPLFTFYRYALMADTWELRDPIAGLYTVASGFRVARHELVQNGNIYWSSLKSFGVPLLSNDVAAAMLFPLTLMLAWLPEAYFWNVFVCIRIILIGYFTYLIAGDFLKLKGAGSWIFTLTFAYSLYVLRWMNHPWQNGFLGGLAYLFFMTKLMETSFSNSRKKWCNYSIGLTISGYSILTSGFPESSVMSAVLVALILMVPIAEKIKNKSLRPKPFLFAVGFSNLFAFMLASPLLLALLEGISNTGTKYRNLFGQAQYGPTMYSLNLLTRLTEHVPDLQDPHFFNLIPLFLFLWGLCTVLKRLSHLKALDLSAFICMVFYTLKLYPVWPWFNKFVGNLPLLKQCWFTTYFLPIFLWGFSYFSAVGADSIFLDEQTKPVSPHNRLKIFFIAGIVFTSLALGIHQTSNLFNFCVLKTSVLFFIFCSLVYYVTKKKAAVQYYGGLTVVFLFVVLSLLEVLNVQPHSFRPFEAEKLYFWNLEYGKVISDLLQTNGISSYDMREDSSAASFANYNIATIDNGYPPILPFRLRRLRQTLFHSDDPEGYSPLVKQSVPYAWQIVGRNLKFFGVQTFLDMPLEKKKNNRLLGLFEHRLLVKDETSLDRAYLASDCAISENWEVSSKMLLDKSAFHVGKVIVEEVEEKESKFCRGLKGMQKSVSIAKDSGTRISISPIQGPALFVLNDTHYPGWRVRERITQKELPIRPANLAFRAVFLLEPKTYELEFYYEPKWLLASKVLVTLAFVGLILLILLSHDKTNFFRRSQPVK